jgi:hypothetical protein
MASQNFIFRPALKTYSQAPTDVAEFVTDGLVLHLDAANPKSYTGSGTVCSDLSVNQYNGTLTNGTNFVTDNEGSFEFDGNDDNIDFGNLTEMNFSNVNFSFEVVFKKFTWDKSYQTIISKGDKTWRLSRNNLTSRLEFSTGSSTGLKTVLSPDVSDNIWYHVTGVYNGSEHLLYLNGEVSNTTSGTTSISASDTQNLMIGDNSEKTGRQFEGLIPLVRIYNRALSEAEIKQNFDALRNRFGL